MNETQGPAPKRPLPWWAKLLLLLALCALLYIPALYILILVLFLLPLNVQAALIGVPAALAALAAAWFLRGRARKWALRGAAGCALLSVLAAGGTLGWNAYQKSITIVDNTAIDTSRYLPFTEDSQIARLDGEPSLQFSPLDDLPVVDGAAALFPVYSAMVNAVYPPNIGALNQEGSPFRYSNTVDGYTALVNGGLDTEGNDAGTCDILFAAAPDEGQLEYARMHGVELEFIPVGREGFIFFTNASNPVDSLTQEELRGIYSGEVTNWKQVGGDDRPIEAFQRNRGSGSQAGLERFMGDVPIMEPPTEWRQEGMGGIIERVADYRNHRGALGFSYYIYASQLKENRGIKIAAVDGVSPSPQTIGDGSYPLTDSFYMVVRKGDRTPEMDRFIAWALGPQGQELVERSGYGPIR